MSETSTVAEPAQNVNQEVPTAGYQPNLDGNTQPTFGAPEPEPVNDTVEQEPEPTKAEPEPELTAKEVIEKIVPNAAPAEITLTLGDHSEVFTQRPLSYFRKIQFMGLLGDAIEDLVNGPDAVNIDAIFGDFVPTSIDGFTGADLGELNTFIGAIAKVASYAPEFLKGAYLIILNVPHNKITFASEALDYIDDDLGEEILIRFIDQNYKELESFFTERFRKVVEHIQVHRQEDD